MKLKAAFLLPLFLMAFAIGCGNAQTENTGLGKALPFEITDIKGGTVRFSDYPGKIVILNFFATWCPPCRMEMPDFNEVSKEYADTVEIIAINVGNENIAGVRNFVKNNNLEFTVAIDDGKVSNLYGPIRAIPVTVIIDRDRNIARRYVGMRTKADLIKDIEALSD